MESATVSADFDEEIAACSPDLYRYTALAEGIRGFGAIGDAERTRFFEDGFLVVDDAFDAAEVQSALDGMLDLIDGQVAGYRGIQYEGKARAFVDTLPRDQKQDTVRKLWRFVDYDQRLKAISEHPAMLAVVRRLMGDLPVLFQDQALLKPPLIGREKPWHQDNAYFNVPPQTPIVGVWIALDEATPENGCMFVIPGSHRAGPVVHFKRRDWQICDTDVATDRSIAVPLKPGGCLLFHGLVHHGTPPTSSQRRRRALQFHYRPASIAPIGPDERMAVFGSEGKDVTC